ncbi:hypothetical protein HYU95_04040 [Candidatus Daviesbacteria bacterium]|nr:hypothetical protein [Candidatus Daviesbacteria bacterium]
MVLELEVKRGLQQGKRDEPVLEYLKGGIVFGKPIQIDTFHELRDNRNLPVSVLRKIQRLDRYAQKRNLDEVDTAHLRLISLYAKRELAQRQRLK